MLPARLCSSFLHRVNDNSERSQLECGHPGHVFTWSRRACRRGDYTQCSLLLWFGSIVSPARLSSALQLVHSQIASWIPSAKRHSWNGDTVETSCGPALKNLLEVITAAKKLMKTVQLCVGLCINRVAREMSQLSAVTLESSLLTWFRRVYSR